MPADLPRNALKARIRAGHPCLGTWLQSASATVAEIVGLAGLDFAIIDQEHGPGDILSAIDAMRALAVGGTPAMVRAPSADPAYLKRITDAGAQSILLPMIDTPAEAAAAVAACLYPPRGMRGIAAAVRASRYGLVPDYVDRAHEEMFLAVQVESRAAVRQAGAIAAVPGIDLVFIGPADLSGSAGVPGQTGAPEVERLVAEALSAIRAAGKPAGTVPREGRTWRDLFADGFQLVAAGSDLAHIRAATAAQAAEWRPAEQK